MAITITKLKMWKNPGYTKGCVNVPPSGSKKLPTPDYTLTAGQTLRPRKNSTISAIELPLSFCQVFEMSYLYMEFHDTANNQVKLFGWIDSIEQTASSDEAVLIRWEVDWWRSYSGSVSYGIGKITRCEEKSYRRPPTIQPRYNVFSKFAEITDSFNTLWGIMVYSDTQNVGGASITWVKTAVFPVGSRAVGWSLETVYSTPSLQDCYNGRLDERLGIDPQAISGIWFSPICPCDQITKRTDSGGDYYDFTSVTVGQSTRYNGYGVPWVNVESIARNEVFIQGTDAVITDYDLRTFGVCDFQGALAGTFPWHSGAYGNDHDPDYITPGYIFARIESGTTSAFLVVYQRVTRFTDAQDSKLAGSSGCMIKIPLPSAPVNTNAMSTFVYSGQRQAEIETAKVNQDQKFVSNLLGVGGSAISGGVGGAVAGKGQGAIIGSAIGTATGLASAFVNNWADNEFRDKLQGISDTAHANQTSQMLLPGDGLLWTRMFPHPYVVKIEADSVTANEYSRMVSANGYETEMFDSPSTLISQGGAIQVTDLNITGNIPPQAKAFIKAMFEKGVKLVEMNPSGVVP